ncbi:hypothetical protein COY05_02745 [Candidatus Peregrinibacteria bacterium CG_4_10_14_0_2_um_filter_38_24]|nr:MAG: hypothetical protein COY05_02745 [Candidatus Peregrinibacteria bacterium CG_4_10_14_0_2_um_filter_38_24]
MDCRRGFVGRGMLWGEIDGWSVGVGLCGGGCCGEKLMGGAWEWVCVEGDVVGRFEKCAWGLVCFGMCKLLLFCGELSIGDGFFFFSLFIFDSPKLSSGMGIM